MRDTTINLGTAGQDPSGRLPGRLGRPRRTRGAALIEMIFVLLVLFYLAMGTVEFGWYLYAKHIVQSAARDGARAGIVAGATQAQLNTAITNTMTSAGFGSIGYTVTCEEIYVNSSGSMVTAVTTDISSVDRSNGLKVTISAPFSAFRVNPLGKISPTKAVTGVCTMVKE